MLPLQVASTSKGMKLNTSSEETALDIKAEGLKRGKIRVDGGLRGKVDDKGGLARGFLRLQKLVKYHFIVCVCSPKQHLYLHKQTPTLTFTATPRKGPHSLVGEDPLDKMGGTSLSSHIENSSEDLEEVRR